MTSVRGKSAAPQDVCTQPAACARAGTAAPGREPAQALGARCKRPAQSKGCALWRSGGGRESSGHLDRAHHGADGDEGAKHVDGLQPDGHAPTTAAWRSRTVGQRWDGKLCALQGSIAAGPHAGSLPAAGGGPTCRVCGSCGTSRQGTALWRARSPGRQSGCGRARGGRSVGGCQTDWGRSAGTRAGGCSACWAGSRLRQYAGRGEGSMLVLPAEQLSHTGGVRPAAAALLSAAPARPPPPALTRRNR